MVPWKPPARDAIGAAMSGGDVTSFRERAAQLWRTLTGGHRPPIPRAEQLPMADDDEGDSDDLPER